MSHFNKERSVLLEGSMVFQHPLVDDSAMRDYHDEVMNVKIEPETRSPAKKVPKPAKKTVKKTKTPRKAKAIKKTAKKKSKPKKKPK